MLEHLWLPGYVQQAEMTIQRAGINRNMYVQDAKRLASLPIAFPRSVTHVHKYTHRRHLPLPVVRGSSACKHKLAAVCLPCTCHSSISFSLSLPLLFTLIRPCSGSKQRGDASECLFPAACSSGCALPPWPCSRVSGCAVRRAARARMPW